MLSQIRNSHQILTYVALRKGPICIESFYFDFFLEVNKLPIMDCFVISTLSRKPLKINKYTQMKYSNYLAPVRTEDGLSSL